MVAPRCLFRGLVSGISLDSARLVEFHVAYFLFAYPGKLLCPSASAWSWWMDEVLETVSYRHHHRPNVQRKHLSAGSRIEFGSEIW